MADMYSYIFYMIMRVRVGECSHSSFFDQKEAHTNSFPRCPPFFEVPTFQFIFKKSVAGSIWGSVDTTVAGLSQKHFYHLSITKSDFAGFQVTFSARDLGFVR